MEKKTHHIIQFIGILTVLTVILLQGLTKVVPSKPLNAFEQKENEPVEMTCQKVKQILHLLNIFGLARGLQIPSNPCPYIFTA